MCRRRSTSVATECLRSWKRRRPRPLRSQKSAYALDRLLGFSGVPQPVGRT